MTDVPADTINNTSTTQIEQQFQHEIHPRLGNWRSIVTDMNARIRNLEKQYARDMRNFQKYNSRRDKKKRTPSGFAKPTRLSNELCNFLDLPIGTEMARTEVTKYLTKYIKDNKLQEESNKRHINPDPKLRKLLGAKKNDTITYFNLQKWMKHHFAPVTSISSEK